MAEATTCSSKTAKSPNTGLADMTTDAGATQKVYDDWASNYEEDTRKWGYDMPEQVASLVSKYLSDVKKSCRILDAGAGDGLLGAALQQKLGRLITCNDDENNNNNHIIDIVGSDLSPEMLEIAKTRHKCYTDTHVDDLSRPPLQRYESDSFDALTCVGTLTYIDPSAKTLTEFCRLVKPGGYICYTHRTDKADQWKAEEAELEKQGKWARIFISKPLPYLPDNPEFGHKILAIINLYRVL